MLVLVKVIIVVSHANVVVVGDVEQSASAFVQSPVAHSVVVKVHHLSWAGVDHTLRALHLHLYLLLLLK